MVRIDVIPALPDHALSIAPRMRKADAREVMASSGHRPLEALMHSLDHSDWAMTGMADGVPEVMFGVCTLNLLNRIGAPWLLGTDAVQRHYRPFLRASVLWKSQMMSEYVELHNMVDDRNEISKRWLRWLGFSLAEPVDIGGGHTFRPFSLRAE